MIEPDDRVLLVGEGREYYVRAGKGIFSTDKGQVDLGLLAGMSAGEIITSHTGAQFTVRIPRPTDFFTHAKRSGAHESECLADCRRSIRGSVVHLP